MRRVVFLKGKNVVLRPLSKQTDIDTITRWINDPEVRWFVSVYLPQMRESEEQWLVDLANAKNPSNIVLAIETIGGKFIGTMGLHNINWKERTATTGALIGEKKYWGRGYGTEAKMLLLDYAFNTLGLHRIGSSVIAYNKRSLQYSLHCGYKIEGKRREQFFKDGERYDEIVLGVFKEEWLAARAKWLKHKRKR